MSLFLLALCAHLCCDFLLQIDSLVAEKNAGLLRAHLKHGLLITVLTWLVTHCYGLMAAFFYAVLVGLAHLVIDGAKSWLEKGKTAGTQLFLFLLDQGLHLLVLWPSSAVSDDHPDPRVTLSTSAFSRHTGFALEMFGPFTGLSVENSLWIAVTYLAAVFGGAVLINRILAWLTDEAQTEKTRRLSSAIGVMERLILITLVAADAVAAVGFVLAAKSLARYQELNNRDFAEYYLVGTLASFTLSLFAGLWLKSIL